MWLLVVGDASLHDTKCYEHKFHPHPSYSPLYVAACDFPLNQQLFLCDVTVYALSHVTVM